MDASSSTSSLKRGFETGSSNNSPSPSKKRQSSGTPTNSAQPGIIQPSTEAPISNVIKESDCLCRKNPPVSTERTEVTILEDSLALDPSQEPTEKTDTTVLKEVLANNPSQESKQSELSRSSTKTSKISETPISYWKHTTMSTRKPRLFDLSKWMQWNEIKENLAAEWRARERSIAHIRKIIRDTLRKRSISLEKSTPSKRAKLDSEEQLNEPVEKEALVDEVETFGEDPEEDPDEVEEFLADVDVLEDEAVLAQVLGVDVASNSAGPTTAEQQEETNRAEDRKLLALMAHFNEDQLSRFEAFRRATFTKSAVSRLISSVSQTTFSPNVVIAMSGITKVFVGELVEEALDYKQQVQETGPLLPKHIRVAYDRLRMKDRTSRPNRHYKMF
ncbi:unnamed protein product [Hymenolepis diminuta]|uniref:Transcription initiation factor TFIID subunit 11 n=1 Tax=Hymenolepis diminuta TaxID=6216 RepID=A0A564YP89_HYMDI|nr:unnamed protein product [Hymenolepis diminuta]